MRLSPFIAAVALGALWPASAMAQPLPDRRFAGPALVCGSAFALRITRGETVVRRDPGIDFLLYYVTGPDGAFTLYEGNAPMAHDDEIRTGLSFPSIIAIHDNRSADAKKRSRIRDRLLTGKAFARGCPAEAKAR